MPIFGIPCMILALVALVFVISRKFSTSTNVLLLIAASVALVIPNVTFANPNHAILVTSSNEPVGVDRSGLVITAPWQARHEFPLAPRTLQLTSPTTAPWLLQPIIPECVSVDSGDVQTCVIAGLRWSVSEDGDDAALQERLARIWREYGTPEELEEQLLGPAAVQTVQQVVGSKPAYIVYDATVNEAFILDAEGRLRHKLEQLGIKVDAVTMATPQPDSPLPNAFDIGKWAGWT
jgi:hypothetical protein